MQDLPALIGPILILDDQRDGKLALSALVIARTPETPPPLTVAGASLPFARLAEFAAFGLWRARFAVPATGMSDYAWNGEHYPIAGDLGGDLRLAYVSCNGEEQGDLARDPAERNVMWRRLARHHREAPFALLLHGGDQIYADEVKHAHPLTSGWPGTVPQDPDAAALETLRAALREAFAQRYAALYAQADFAFLAARVPSLMQWDDHDICDGWGSLPDHATLSGVGQTLFSAAREAALLFQHGCVEGDLPPRFDDPEGRHLGWRVEAPGLRLIAPDLRSQRSPTRVMGPEGWDFVARMARETGPGHRLVMSSVPLLGPRLSLIERFMLRLPKAQKYEDDLRDQWQSRAHREAWIRMLREMQRLGQDGPVTVLSGEIHLATRAEMPLGHDRILHQLVASGITHRAPPAAWAWVLGALAWLGEGPLPDAPIRILPLPGQSGRYVAQRNALLLARQGDRWSARWDLEQTGLTPSLALD